MSERPTPETDAELYPINGVDIVWPEFARNLEQERDEAREELRIAVGLLSTHPQFANKHPDDVLAFVKEGAK
jgi:hypothetical protein